MSYDLRKVGMSQDETAFEYTPKEGRPLTLIRATFTCYAEIEVTDSHRVVMIEFEPTAGKRQTLWFAFTGSKPPRSLNGAGSKQSLTSVSAGQARSLATSVT